MSGTVNRKEGDGEILRGIPDYIRDKLLAMSDKLDELETVFEKLEPKHMKDVQDRMTPLESAKLNWISIYALNSLFFVYLKNNGANVKDHAIMSELIRVKNYLMRINEITEKEEAEKKSHLTIDKESSARIIKRSLWAHATNKSKAGSKVTELVNATLDTGVQSVQPEVENSTSQDDSLNNKRHLEEDTQNNHTTTVGDLDETDHKDKKFKSKKF